MLIRKNFSEIILKFQNFKFLTIMMKIQSKKMTLKLFFKILKHVFCNILFEFCEYATFAE